MNDNELLEKSKKSKQPVMLFSFMNDFSVTIDGHVFSGLTELESVFVFITCWSVFMICWDKSVNGDSIGQTQTIEILHR